jgi:hypothetical protein
MEPVLILKILIMNNLKYLIIICFFAASIWSCQREELPELATVESLNSTLAGTWKPVRHQLEYWKLNENIVQLGSDTIVVYAGDSIKGYWAFYNSVPCDTLNMNSNGTWTIFNRRKADANSGKDLKWADTTKTIAGAKTTILIKKRYWSVTEVVSQGTSDYGPSYPYLKLGTENTQTVQETGKSDMVTRWWTYNKVFTLLSVESGQLVVGYQALMSVSYRPGVLKGQPDQKTNRYVTNTITFSK